MQAYWQVKTDIAISSSGCFALVTSVNQLKDEGTLSNQVLGPKMLKISSDSELSSRMRGDPLHIGIIPSHIGEPDYPIHAPHCSTEMKKSLSC